MNPQRSTVARAACTAALLVIAAPRVGTAQSERDLLLRAAHAYDVAEYGSAKMWLLVGMNPGAGPRDTLWGSSVHRLAHILVQEQHDSLAELWVRWALRLDAALVVDTLNFPPAVQDVFTRAGAFIAASNATHALIETEWAWPTGPAADTTSGFISIKGAGVVSGFIDRIGPIPAGGTRRVPPGSYAIDIACPGLGRTHVTTEVLPGTGTTLTFRTAQAPVSSRALTEPQIDMLRGQLTRDRVVATPTLLAETHLQLGVAHWSLGLLDSAATHFAAATAADPSILLPADASNPILVAALRTMRRVTPAVSVRAPRDTMFDASTGRWPLRVAVGHPGTVAIRIFPLNSAQNDVVSTTAAVDSALVVPIPLVGADRTPLGAGVYRLRATYALPDSQPVLATLAFELSAPDTLLHEPEPSKTAYRPELRSGRRPRSSLIRGVGLGVAAGLVPLLLGNHALPAAGREVRAVIVGATAAAAGVLGYLRSGGLEPDSSAMTYNRRLRSAWETRNREIIVANAARLDGTNLRVRLIAP